MQRTSIAGVCFTGKLFHSFPNREDWGVIFTLLEVVGAGASPAMPGQVSSSNLLKSDFL